MEFTGRFYDKNKPSGDAVKQYHIILRMLESSEELIAFNRIKTDAEALADKIQRKENRRQLRNIKRQADALMKEYQKYIREMNNELNKMMKLPKLRKNERNLLWQKL